MRIFSFALALLLLPSFAFGDTILTYTGQDYSTTSTGCTFIYSVQQSTCTAESALKPAYTTSMSLTIQIDLADTVTLPGSGELTEYPLLGGDVVSETINDGGQTISNVASAQTDFIDLIFSNGAISGWDIKVVTPESSLGYVQTLSSCFQDGCGNTPTGDVAHQDYYAQNDCADFASNAFGDCPVHWSDYASTSSTGSWSVATALDATALDPAVITASEPSSLALLGSALFGLFIARSRLFKNQASPSYPRRRSENIEITAGSGK